jgi:sialidase-1
MFGALLLMVPAWGLAQHHDQSAAAADTLYRPVRGGLTNSFIRFVCDGVGRVAFLGGSITENPGWRDSVCSYLRERFPQTRFEFVSAGIASTGSTPGAFRLEHDVLSKGKVDLLFEEAAVNDATNGFDTQAQVRGMEGIVRHARMANVAMDIVLMYFVDPDKMASYNKGAIPTEIRTHDAVALHYNLPSVNLAREVTDRINAGEFTWERDFKDLHPSPFGQNIYYRSIRKLLEACWNTLDLQASPVAYPLPDPLDRFSYCRGAYLDIRLASALKGWSLVDRWKPTDGKETRKGFADVPMLVGEEPGASLELAFSGTAVGLCVAAGPDAGIIEYSVDGGPFKKQDTFTLWSKWLHLPWYYVLESELPAGSHRIRIRISADKNSESAGHACRVVQFLVNGEQE